MKIQKALQTDQHELTIVMRKSKAYWNYEQQQLDDWQDELTISPEFIMKNQVFKLLDKNKIVGFFAYSLQNKTLKLESLFLLPEYIGSGLGKLLMNVFLNKIKGLPIKRIVLDADPNTESFYNNFNFQTVSLKITAIENRFMPIMVKPVIRPKSNRFILFETDRLLIQQLREDDLEEFHNMQSNPKVMKYIKKPMTFTESKKELERFMQLYNQRDILFRLWAAYEKSTGFFVGICGVYLNEKKEYELAYRLLEKHWGKGLGAEMAKNLIDYCFNILQYDEVVAYIDKKNKGSLKIAKQIMNFDKELYSDKYKCLEHVYRLGKDEWLQRSTMSY